MVDMKGNFLFTNKAMEAALGYSRKEMKKMNGFELVHPDDLETVRTRFARLVEGKKENNIRYRYRNKSGIYMNVLNNAAPVFDSQGVVVAAFGIARDITQLKWVEEALRDRPEGEFTYASPSAKVMFGIAPGQAIGLHWRDLIDWTPESVALAERTVAAASRGEHIEPVELTYTHPKGSVRIIEVTAHPVTDENGAVNSIEGIAHDITERKRAEAELEQRVKARTAELATANAELSAEIAERTRTQKTLEKAYREIEQLKQEIQAASTYLQEEIKLEHDFETIIGQSRALKHVFSKVRQVAPTDATVLILGETGTGKELVARAIHDASPRSHRLLVKVNCAALPPSLMESELFGHEKGAFSGAHARREGRFELADKGTLFLDEIAELPMGVQAKLLRVLQEGEFERLGSSQTLCVNVRIIASTNRNLEEYVREDRFREDLWYRLNVFPITVPPLRERREDIPLLIQFFVDKSSKKVGRSIHTVTPETIKVLTQYAWPGNVRELENVIERAVIASPDNTLRLTGRLEAPVPVPWKGRRKTMAETEKEYIRRTLAETRWRIGGKQGAARLLGLHPSTLRGRMRKYGIIKPWLAS
jgi:PAS domain S-box-containing protein